MSQQVEKDLSRQYSAAPTSPRFRNVIGLRGAYIKEIWNRAEDYLRYYPDAEPDELVSTISLQKGEQFSVDFALAAINQLSVLGIPKRDVTRMVRTFRVQSMTPPGTLVYEVVWRGELPASLLTEPPEIGVGNFPVQRSPIRTVKLPDGSIHVDSPRTLRALSLSRPRVAYSLKDLS